MRSLIAFTKKEWMEQSRSGRLFLLGILFFLLGVMNPAIAKLTPWMYEVLSDSIAESGLTVATVAVDAMTSWAQFFKNAPMGLIVFILLESSVFTREYQSGTLVLTLTKGFARYKVVVSKGTVLATLWTACYWLSFAVTYGYNEFFWNNADVENLLFSAFCWWLLGMWAVLSAIFFSALARANTGVIIGTGATFFAAYLIGLLPGAKAYSPSMLMSASSLLSGTGEADSYSRAIAVTVALCALFAAAGVVALNRKRL